MRPLLPAGWPRPKGYSNGIQAEGQIIFVAGMIGWDTEGRLPRDFVAQLELVFGNTIAVLREGGAGPENIVRMTWYVKGLDLYRANLDGIGRAYREIIGKNFPAMAVVGVTELVEPDALIEIETTAVVAPGSEQ